MRSVPPTSSDGESACNLIMFERIRHMLIKEFIQVFRDPRMRIVIFVIPCVQVLVIGYAVTTDVTPRADGASTISTTAQRAARWWPASCDRATSTSWPASATTGRCTDLLDHGDVTVVLRFNHGFADDLRAGRTAAAADHRRRHRLEHGQHRGQLRHEDRHGLLAADRH